MGASDENVIARDVGLVLRKPIDTQDLDHPRLISHLTKSQLYNQISRSAHPVGDLLILSPAAVATKREDHVFMDVSDPAHPTLIGRHKIELGYQGFVYGTRFYNGAFAEARGEDPVSRIIAYGFAAPEQIDPAFGSIGPKTDIYAIGGLLHWLISRKPPNHGASLEESLASTLSSYDPEVLPSEPIPEALRNILIVTLRKSPADRTITITDIVAKLDSAADQAS